MWASVVAVSMLKNVLSVASKQGKKWTARWWETVSGRVGRFSAVSRSRVHVWNWKCGGKPCSSSVFLGVWQRPVITFTVCDETITSILMFFKHLTLMLGSADVVWSLVKRWLALSDWPGIVAPQEPEDELKLRVAVMHPYSAGCYLNTDRGWRKGRRRGNISGWDQINPISSANLSQTRGTPTKDSPPKN